MVRFLTTKGMIATHIFQDNATQAVNNEDDGTLLALDSVSGGEVVACSTAYLSLAAELT